MLTKRKLAFTAAVLLAGLLGMNIAMVYLTRDSIPHRLIRHVRSFQSATVLAVGNSLIADDFNEPAFDASAGFTTPGGGAVDIGLGATEPAEHLILLRYALAQGLRPRIVVYGFYDFQLTEPVAFTNGDLIGDNAMAYYVEPSYGRRIYGFSLRDELEFRAMHRIPMFVERGSVWARIEILRRRLAQQGLPFERNDPIGRASDFSILESQSSKEFGDKCEASMNLPLTPAVRELMRQSNESGATVSIVEMPMRQRHRALFYDTGCWNEYVTHLRSLLGNDRVNFIDASAWIEDEGLYKDALHLSVAGAEQFSRRLAGELNMQLASGIGVPKPN
jgi:hypothetical protein